MSSPKPDLTLYFLNSSRAIRIVWLLEELEIPYKLISGDRAPDGLAHPEHRNSIPHPLNKFPTIVDKSTSGEEIVITESGAIVQYLCDNYDTSHRLIPSAKKDRAEVNQWIHAAEGTFAVHSMAILYSRWRMPPSGQGLLEEIEVGMSKNVINDMNWLEKTLLQQKGKGSGWIVGEGVTAADVMMQFSIEFIYARKLGNQGLGAGQWPEIEAWLKRTMETESYKRAVEKTGYTLEGNFRK